MKLTGKYKLFADCIVVKGFSRSTICDLSRKFYYFIPNDMAHFLDKLNSTNIEDLYFSYSSEFYPILDEYLDFLIEKELIFLDTVEQPDSFTPLNLKFEYPGEVSNFVMEVSDYNISFLKMVLCDLEKLGCFHIQLKSKNIFNNNILNELKANVPNSSLLSIEIICKYDSISQSQELINFCASESRIKSLVLHSAHIDKFDQNSDNYSKTFYTTSAYEGSVSCGQISHLYFNTSIELFTESINHNSCLNRKIGIDEFGEIKNCPSLLAGFGNISEISLIEAIKKEGFKKLWNIKKDDINVCQDCEFRHVCTDCRAFIESPENIYSKPLKCGYSPYTNEWEEWSNNPLKKHTFNQLKKLMHD